ncbi:CASP8 and FADD-like apoptosis regulator [Larimichthys crocea]|uniref:Uncharacterized protein n=1 Tax=Larimichthys crocea TaxID=215358 RepID=A0ACD3QIB8_LARCR|nr:CASP8 and FADD-like apoptosis regulator [Larimichthys crocea]
MIPPHCNGAEPQRDTIGQTERNSVRDGGQRPRPALRGRCGGGNGETFTAVGHRGSERTCARRSVSVNRKSVIPSSLSYSASSFHRDRGKFLFGFVVSVVKFRSTKSFLDLIIELEKLDVVSPERVDFLEECLRNIDRIDLAKKVTAYKLQVGISEHLPQTQRGRSPRPFSAPNGTYPPQPARRALSCHSESLPVPICREQSRQSQQELYKFNTNPRGVCVIIDCVG